MSSYVFNFGDDCKTQPYWKETEQNTETPKQLKHYLCEI